MHKLMLALILAGVATASPAQTIYKCADSKGAITFQNQPCPSDAKVKAAKDYQPAQDNARAAKKLQLTEREMARQQDQQYGPGTTHVTRMDTQGQSSAALCEQAKRDRNAALEAAGSKRTYELVQKHDENVLKACR